MGCGHHFFCFCILEVIIVINNGLQKMEESQSGLSIACHSGKACPALYRAGHSRAVCCRSHSRLKSIHSDSVHTPKELSEQRPQGLSRGSFFRFKFPKVKSITTISYSRQCCKQIVEVTWLLYIRYIIYQLNMYQNQLYANKRCIKIGLI